MVSSGLIMVTIMLVTMEISMRHHLASALAMEAPQCAALESDFEQSLAHCFKLLGSNIHMETIANTVNSNTDGLVAEMELSLRSADQMSKLCSNLTGFKACQDRVLNSSSQRWSSCSWWTHKAHGYVQKVDGYHETVCQRGDYKKNWFCIGKMLSSYLAERCNKMLSQRNSLTRLDNCELSNEYLGCLSALISTGCGSEFEQVFRPVAARMLGQYNCQPGYNYNWPGYAFKFDGFCSTEFQSKVRENEDLFRARTDIMMLPGDYPIVRTGREFSLRKDLCDTVHEYERRAELINRECRRGYNLLRALFEWKPRFYQMKFICDNIEEYSASLPCMQTASFGQCEQHATEARGLLFHRLEMQCTDYSKRTMADLQAVWDAGSRCLESAMSRQCGGTAGRLFGTLARIKNSLLRFEIDCNGDYIDRDYRLERFLNRLEPPVTRATVVNDQYVADGGGGGSSGGGGVGGDGRSWQQQQQQHSKVRSGQSRSWQSSSFKLVTTATFVAVLLLVD